MSELELLTKAERMLAEVASVPAAVELVDLAAAARDLAERAKLGTSAVNHAQSIRIKAEMRMADLVDEGQAKGQIRKAGGDQSNIANDNNGPDPLPVPAYQLHQARKLRDAYTPEQIDELLSNTDDVVSRSSLINKAKRKKKQQDEQDARDITLPTIPADAQGEGWRMLAGDFRDRANGLPTGSVDIIVTDPPYPAEFIDLWGDLSEHAARILKPQGILVALTGKIQLPDVMQRLGQHLNYGWMYAEPLPGANTRILARKVLQEWKPWLAYSNGAWPSSRVDWMPDLLDGSPPVKDDYRWQQNPTPAAWLIERLTDPGAIVFDPFTGTGSYGLAALARGREFIGCEADTDRYTLACDTLAGAK